jgi:DNA adenine methylase
MSSTCLPFLKWAGGKRKVTGLLQSTFPESFFVQEKNYYEPFVGGGALALSLGDRGGILGVPGSRLHLNDMNPDLVVTYSIIRDHVEELISRLDKIEKEFKDLDMPNQLANNIGAPENSEKQNRADYFYKVRSEEPSEELDIAARLIFLNKTCFNGLWRVNSKGKFNVPYGHHKNPSLYDRQNLEECSRRLQGASITHLEFHEAVASATAGDLVYFDPPYIPLNLTSSFSQYSKNDFGLNEQRKLAQTIEELTQKGVYVILSNSDTPETTEIFGEKLELRRILMSRFISASGSNRNSVFEVIGTNFEIPADSLVNELELI